VCSFYSRLSVCLHQAIATGKGPNGYTDITILYLCYLLHLSTHSNFRSNQTIITGSFTVDAWWMPMLGIPVCLATTWGVVRGEPHQLAIQAQTSLSLLKMSFSPDNPDANGAIRKGQILTKAPELLWCVCFPLLKSCCHIRWCRSQWPRGMWLRPWSLGHWDRGFESGYGMDVCLHLYTWCCPV
jgi:hypothetical protein